jgi:hypothetical protein
MPNPELIREKFKNLLIEGEKIMRFSGWDGHTFKENKPNSIDYRRFRTEAMNLIKRVCGEGSDHYQELKRLAEGERSSENSYYFKDCFGVLQAAERDFEGGYLFDMRSIISAELLGDFMDQAETLFQGDFYIPAASLSGAVLEDTLRRLSEKHSIPILEETSLGQLNENLYKADIYDKLIMKRIIVIADIRNNADHGKFDKFKRDDVEDMIKWIRRFTADYLK